jgi:Domain of unknown function (DUF4249)
MKRLNFILLILLTTGACIDPFIINLPETQESLVVDGLITDAEGPYTVKLSRSLPVNKQLEQVVMVSNALVVIHDDAGTEETLKQINPGIYETTNIQGVIGRTYFISISINGKTYESIPEKMLPIGDITGLSTEFVSPENPPSTAPDSVQNGFNVYLDGTLAPEQDGLIRYRWTGTFEIFTYPSRQRTIKIPQGPPSDPPETVPDPPLCSGWVDIKVRDRSGNFFNGPTKVQIDTACTCCTCWINENNVVPILARKADINNNTVTKLKMAFVAASRRHFFKRYYLEVEQLSVSRAVYDFWNNVKDQKENGSNLFQTPPPRTVGNLSSTTDGGLPVIGVFSVSASKKHSILIMPKDIPYHVSPIDTIEHSCLSIYKNSTATKPLFW